MNIVLIIPSFKRTGPNFVALSMLKGFREIFRNQLDITLCCLSSEGDVELKNEFILVSKRHITHKSKFISLVKTLKYIVSNKPDIVHSHTVLPDFLNAITSFSGGARISTVHCYPQVDIPLEYNAFKANFLLKLHLFSLAKLTRLVGCSKAVASNLTKIGLRSNTSILNAIDTKQYNRSRFNSHDIRSNFKISDSEYVLVYVGRVIPRKRVDKILDMFGECNIKNITLLIVGDNEQNLISENDKVKFIPAQKEVLPYLFAANGFISLSQAEGCPMSLLEAISCGLTPFLSPIEPHVEILNLIDNKGYRISSASDLRVALTDAQASLKDMHMESTLSADLFSQGSMADSYYKLYEECINEYD